MDLGTHLQIAHTLHLLSYLVFVKGSSKKDYFLMSNRNHLHLALKCITYLSFLQTYAHKVWVQLVLKVDYFP